MCYLRKFANNVDRPFTIQVGTKINIVDRTLLKLEQSWKWVYHILLKLEIRLKSYSIEEKNLSSTIKLLIWFWKCANYQEMSRPYTVVVERKINMGRSYTYQWKKGRWYTVKVRNFHKKSPFCAKKLLN